jgi:hypothetical protein
MIPHPEKITPSASKMITYMVHHKNDNIRAFKPLYTGKLYSFSSAEDVIIFHDENFIFFEFLNVIIFQCTGCYHYSWCKFYLFEGLDVIISSVEEVIIFHGINIIIFEVLDVIIF